jgi:cytochrome d ubiquinol oxidase subunit II
LPALLWGVTVGNLLHGLPIDAERQYAGTLWQLLSPYALTCGLVFAALFSVHGSAYLILKLDAPVAKLMEETGLRLCKYALGALVVFGIMTYAVTDISAKPVASLILLLSAGAMVLVAVNFQRRHYLIAFIFSAATIALVSLSIFSALFPRIAVSSLNPGWSLDIYNSASNQLALKIISTAMLAVLPLILLFEGWKYYIFRHKISVTEPESVAHANTLSRMNTDLKEQVTHASFLADVMKSVLRALRSGDGNIINRLKPKHKALLLDKPQRKPPAEDEDKPK